MAAATPARQFVKVPAARPNRTELRAMLHAARRVIKRVASCPRARTRSLSIELRELWLSQRNERRPARQGPAGPHEKAVARAERLRAPID